MPFNGKVNVDIVKSVDDWSHPSASPAARSSGSPST
jgi:hypothetical protein